jgi:putative tricarboxylic transport membrane protein
VIAGRVQKRKAYLVVGFAGILLSVAYLAMGAKLPFGQMDQPGAGVFPMVVGVIMLFSSAAAVLEGWRMDPSLAIELPVGVDRQRVVGVTGFVLGYFLLLPWVGHLLASVLFFILTIRLLSDYGWPRILITSALLSGALYLIFVRLLQVALPAGEIWS